MANIDLLQTFLQLHLATDAVAVINLPSILSSLTSKSLESSSHLVKWTNRVNALIHCREPGARWAGITLALHTSKLSRNVLVSSAQSWVSTILPMLSRNESPTVWKVAIRLLSFVFTSTTDLAEFQRHVVTTNIPKFSSALMSLAEKQADEELKLLCLQVLAATVSTYPSLHRQLSSPLSALSLSFLNGSPSTTPTAIASSASKLHASLHTTGGKVGGAALWRKSVDETVVFCSAAVTALRTTFMAEDKFIPSNMDPLISVSLNLDRLFCGVELLCHLLRTSVSRPVTIPTGPLVSLCVELIRVTGKGTLRDDTDPLLRSLEVSSVPRILELGCLLTSCLSRCVQSRLAPHLTRILGIVAYHLEQPTTTAERLPFVKLVPSLLGSCLPPAEPLISGRIIKSILPAISSLLSQKNGEEDSAVMADAGGKKGKRRARGYEGDEVFKVGRDALCESSLDGELILAALDALPYLLRVPNIPAYLQSLSSRLLLSLLIALPTLPASAVSQDPTFKKEILRRVKSICIGFASGSTGILCKSLPLVVDAIADQKETYTNVSSDSDRNILLLDIMLRPRVPPLLRPLPSLDTVALCRSEEGADERTTRESLGLRSVNGMDVDDEVEDTADSAPASDAQRIPADTTSTESDSLPAPVVIPTMPIQPAAPIVVQPMVAAAAIPPVSSSNNITFAEVQKASQAQNNASAVDGPSLVEEQKSLSMTQALPASSQPQPTRSSEPGFMIIDDDDEEEEDDIEMPALNLESDTDSEQE